MNIMLGTYFFMNFLLDEAILSKKIVNNFLTYQILRNSPRTHLWKIRVGYTYLVYKKILQKK